MSTLAERALRRIEPISIDDVRAARERIAGSVLRTPLVRLNIDSPSEIYLKLESLQPIGSFKLRGATNAIQLLPVHETLRGVVTASAGNMAQGVAWGARERGVPCTVIIPENAPRSKVDGAERLGADIIHVPYDEWWQTLADHGRAGVEGAFIHPVADATVIAGNGTIGLEILEDLPDVDTVLVPFGGGGLLSGISTVMRALSPKVRMYGCEVATSTPLTAALAAKGPVMVDRTPSFVDGIGGRGVLPEMWPILEPLVDGALVATLSDVAHAVRLLVERGRVVAEGAGATPVACALARREAGEKVVCIVSGGNVDLRTLIELLTVW